jgi:hypothetical protein
MFSKIHMNVTYMVETYRNEFMFCTINFRELPVSRITKRYQGYDNL